MAESSPEWATELSEGHPLLDQLIRSNATRLGIIGQKGVGVDITRAMVQHLLETIYPDKKDRQEYETHFQKYLGELLTSIEEQVDAAAAAAAQATLATPQPGLIVPGR